MSAKATTKLAMKRHKKLDKIYYPDNNLVINSQTEKLVIGRISDDEFVPLDDEALELCEKLGLKYDESLVQTEEEETEAPKEEEEEQEQVQEEPVQEEPVQEEQPVPKAKVTPPEEEKPASKNNIDAVGVIVQNAKMLGDLLMSKMKEATVDKERVAELEKQLSATKKELDDVKKKLKGVLSAMQGEL